MTTLSPAPIRSGSAKWISARDMVPSLLACEIGALLVIDSRTQRGLTTAMYCVTQEITAGRVTGYNLMNEDTGRVWHVDSSFGGGRECCRCNCPDAVRRMGNGGCKHARALEVALRRVGIEL